ncbi:hypothetical protein BC834DRAFT_844567 [Gloeopeniophorella convolvens]|nr:hypothetical protein BC834DRAFT_844567 [Gloeopeniophorella convolvens]
MTSQGQNANPNLAFIDRLARVHRPDFASFNDRRLGGAPQLELILAPDHLPLPEDPPNEAAGLLTEEQADEQIWQRLKTPQDVVFLRFPPVAGPSATMFILLAGVSDHWPRARYAPIGKRGTACLQVMDLRNKGKGCLAAHPVARGALVARERALLVMPQTFLCPEETIVIGVHAMPEAHRNAYYGLTNSVTANRRDVMGIAMTNALRIPGLPSHNAAYWGIFETFSRINHRYVELFPATRAITNEAGSCGPNAVFRWDQATFSGEIRALRPIAEGEEVTISYLQGMMDPTAVAHRRHTFLWDRYHFNCACIVCTRISGESDRDRPAIRVYVSHLTQFHREMVLDWIKRGGNDHASLLEFLHVIESGLDRDMIFDPVMWINVARSMVMVYCALHIARLARQWAQRAAQHSRAAIGSDGGWDAVAREPERCAWWGAWGKPGRLRGVWA